MKNVVGMNLNLLRKNAEKTQRNVEEDLKLGERTWSHYENGQRNIPNDLLIDIANYFGVTVDYLFEVHKDTQELQESIARVLATKDITTMLERSDLWHKHLDAEGAMEYSWSIGGEIGIPNGYEEFDPEDYYEDSFKYADYISDDDEPKNYSKIVGELEDELIHGNTEVLEGLIKAQYDWTRQDMKYDTEYYQDLDTIQASLDEINEIDKVLTYCMIARHHLLSFLEKCYGI